LKPHVRSDLLRFRWEERFGLLGVGGGVQQRGEREKREEAFHVL
jgi:hypothetical protein